MSTLEGENKRKPKKMSNRLKKTTHLEKLEQAARADQKKNARTKIWSDVVKGLQTDDESDVVQFG